MATRDELQGALAARHRGAGRAEKGRVLTKFAEVTGSHRKHAARVLRATTRPDRSRPRPERRLYDEAVREALIVARGRRRTGSAGREAAAADPDADRGDGAARVLGSGRGGARAARDGQRCHDRQGAGTGEGEDVEPTPVRGEFAGDPARAVPIRTYADWGDPAPGFMEADLVAHSGPSTSGSFVREAGAHRRRHRLDRVRAAALARAAAARGGHDGDARGDAIPLARLRHGQRQPCSSTRR